MKKVALLIAILTIFTSTAFAEIDVTVEGSSELTFGIALDGDTAAGFSNTNSSKISFTLASGTSEKGSDADTYGWIEIADWEAVADSDDGYADIAGGDVTAKIMFTGGWVTISGSNTGTNFTTPAFFDATEAGDDAGDYAGVNVDFGGAGFVLGLEFAPATIELGVSTPNDWTNDDDSVAEEYGWVDNDSNDTTEPVWAVSTAAVADADDANDEYTFGTHLKVTLDLSPITVEVAAVTDINPNSNVGIGAKVSADIAPLTLAVAADINTDAGDYEVNLDASIALAEGISLALGGSYSSISNIDAFVDFDAAIDAISVGLVGIFADVDTDDLAYIVELETSYTTDMVKPYVTVGYGTISGPDGDNDDLRTIEGGDADTNLTVGVEAYLIENVTFKGEWSADPVGDTNGTITLGATIEY